MRGVTGAISEEQSTCLICGQDLEGLDDYDAPLVGGARGWDLQTLPCQHTYHRACVVSLSNKGQKTPCHRCYIPPADSADRLYDAAVRARVRAQMAIDGSGVLFQASNKSDDLHEKAEQMVREALRAGPERFNAQTHLGLSLLMEAKDVDGAIAAFRLAIAANPHHAPAHYGLGRALYMTRRQNKLAIKHIRKATSLHPNYASAFQDLGSALFMDQQYDAAIAQFKQVLAINPLSVNAYKGLSSAYKQKGPQYQAQAQEALAKAREISPDFDKKPLFPPSFWDMLDENFNLILTALLIVLAIGLHYYNTYNEQ